MKRSTIFLWVLTCSFLQFLHAQSSNCQADFSSTASGIVVNFQDQSTASTPISSYIWNFGDGTFSNQQNPTHAYVSAGNYVVGLTITSQSGCTDVFWDSLSVSGTCSTSCQAAFTHVETGAVVSFSDTSYATGNIIGWYWDFGDGTFSYSQNPNHAYAVSGVYTACLTITTDDSCSSTVCDSFYVQCSSPCGPASFTYTQSGNTIAFNNTSAGTFASSEWIFSGTGIPNNNQTNPTITFPNPGTFNVCLCIYDGNGNLCDIVCDTVVIPGSPLNCQANFFALDSGNNVIFTNASSSNGTIVAYNWDFGDGNTSFLENPIHFYNTPGTYLPCLTITALSANDTCHSTYCDTITVGQVGCNGVANFTYTVSGNTVSFTNTSTGNFATSEWIFSGSGLPSSILTNPTITFPGPGTYNVCLCIYDANGNLCDIICLPVVIGGGQSCQADFYAIDSGLTVYFQNQSQPSGGSVSYEWNFGDGSISYQQHPIYSYNNPGTYVPCLTIYAIDAQGDTCIDTHCDTLVINGTGGCNLNAAFTYTLNGNTATFTNNSTLPTSGYWYWWIDGSYLSQLNPTYTFPGPGTYFACFLIGDSTNWNCYDSACVTITVPPTGITCNADFIAIDSGNTVNFINTSSSSASSIYYYWQFGDGNVSYQQNPVHFYNSPGTYGPCLTITSISATGDTCTDVHCDTVNIGGGGCNALASFTYTLNGNTATFTNNSTLPSSPFWNWWIDGNYLSQFNPTYTFPGPGTYYACLFVSDSTNWNCYDSTCVTITVPPGSGCNASASFTTSIVGNTVQFTNTSTLPNAPAFYWYFSDGSSSTVFNPVKTFPGPGNYFACLTVVDSTNWNCYDSICMPIQISQRQWNAVSHVPMIGMTFRSAPNPTQDITEISYELTEDAEVRISVYDLAGKEVRVITEGSRGAGIHSREWRAADLPAGMYLYRIQVDDQVQTEKFLKL